MSYLCELCSQPRTPGQVRLRHLIRKPDGNIQREVAVCPDCDLALKSCTLPQLRQAIAKRQPQPEPFFAPPAPVHNPLAPVAVDLG